MKVRYLLTMAVLVVLTAFSSSIASLAQGRQELAHTSTASREQTILHAAGAAVSAANGNGGPNTHLNMYNAGFPHKEGDFQPRNNVGQHKISFRLVWNEDAAIIGFQGAMTPEHQRLFAESLVVRSRLQYGRNVVEAPAGFLAAYTTAKSEILSELSKAGGLVRNGRQGKKLVITGHSMGGLVANFLAADLLWQGYKVDTVVTFGTPHVATQSFKAFLEGTAASRGTKLISVENVHDSKITRWFDIAGLRTTPGYYLNRIGAPVNYAFLDGEHDMKLYYGVAKARGLSKVEPQTFPKVDGTYATVWPVANPRLSSVVRIKYWPQSRSGSWWKALKVVDKQGRSHFIEVENGRFLNGRQEMVFARSLFEDQIRVEFWKAKTFGIHTHVVSENVIITPGGDNAINVWW